MPRYFDQTDTAPATLLRRLGAIGYDFMVVIAISFAVTACWLWIMDVETAEGAGFKSALLVTVFSFFALFWTRTGQTIGMMAWRIRIQAKAGHNITLMQALIRFFVAAFSAFCLGAGYLWMLFDDERLTWQDRLSNSEVVYLPKKK
ncbi:MAG: RDD family protein [Pseudomonadales bacterium]